MSAAPLDTVQPGDANPLAEVLAAIAQLHDLVVACDEAERIRWVSPELEALCAGAGSLDGEPLSRLIEDPLARARLHEGCRGAGGFAAARTRLRAGADALEAELSAFRLDDQHAIHVIVARRVDAPGVAGDERHPDAVHLCAILDSAPDPVIATDRTGFVSYANPAAQTLLQRSRDALEGHPIAMLLPETNGLGSMLRELRRGTIDRHDFELRGGEDTRWLSVSSRPLQMPDGSTSGSVLFLRDVTERKRAEAALEAKNEELEGYVRTVSHDLRSPLVSVLGFARLLEDDFGEVLGEKGRHFLRRIEQAGRTMESLIDDLLELSRIGRDGEPASLVDPRAVLMQVLSEWKAAIETQRIEVVLPDTAPVVCCNRTRLYQLLSNLIGNAILHMGPSPAPRIEVRIREEGPLVHLQVRDNGRGIPEEQHERIFEVFQTLGPRPDGRKSSGVGLAIVRKIAATGGGRAWVESRPGEGATFHVTLRNPAPA